MNLKKIKCQVATAHSLITLTEQSLPATDFGRQLFSQIQEQEDNLVLHVKYYLSSCSLPFNFITICQLQRSE